jgi:hypothetical protein
MRSPIAGDEGITVPPPPGLPPGYTIPRTRTISLLRCLLSPFRVFSVFRGKNQSPQRSTLIFADSPDGHLPVQTNTG